ncbi:alpha-amylase family glycosyl hydrolase [Arthrobacter sp. AL12]|uniref:alpha-amylase family glycosyl hydrolase n=1 Tax=Arthrobacter sp. AL12 TaxID=3042241 RepID=UPI00249CAAC7|nr:alpha-amylase family glycosyl hydrolase [Arthrobacter sp. AL12]MDI3212765.1 alpha-amylase family glycosyl hydrolase [Arthrobacter sp. AL12]
MIGDLTANHSGDDHEWFRRALAEPGSAKAGYYYFNDDHTEYEAWYGSPRCPNSTGPRRG